MGGQRPQFSEQPHGVCEDAFRNGDLKSSTRPVEAQRLVRS